MHTEMTTEQWLATLQPHDKVLLYRGYGLDPCSVEVEGLTKTQILIKTPSRVLRFRRQDGLQVGPTAMGRDRIRPYDEAVLEAVVLRDLQVKTYTALRNVQRQSVMALPQEDCEAVLNLLRQYKLMNGERENI